MKSQVFLEDILAFQRRKGAWLHFYVLSVLRLQGLEDGCWWTSFTAYPWINHVCLKPGHQRKPRKTVLKSSVFNYLSFYSSLSSICFPWNVPETFPSQRFCMDQAFYKKHAPARNPHGSVPFCLQVFTLMSCSRAYSDHPIFFFFLMFSLLFLNNLSCHQ